MAKYGVAADVKELGLCCTTWEGSSLVVKWKLQQLIWQGQICRSCRRWWIWLRRSLSLRSKSCPLPKGKMSQGHPESWKRKSVMWALTAKGFPTASIAPWHKGTRSLPWQKEMVLLALDWPKTLMISLPWQKGKVLHPQMLKHWKSLLFSGEGQGNTWLKKLQKREQELAKCSWVWCGEKETCWQS